MTRFDIGQRCRLLFGAGFRFGARSARCKLLLGILLLGQKHRHAIVDFRSDAVRLRGDLRLGCGKAEANGRSAGPRNGPEFSVDVRRRTFAAGGDRGTRNRTIILTAVSVGERIPRAGLTSSSIILTVSYSIVRWVIQLA